MERRSQAQKIAPQLVIQARQELTDPILQEQVLRFIQTIVSDNQLTEIPAAIAFLAQTSPIEVSSEKRLLGRGCGNNRESTAPPTRGWGL